MCLSLGIKWQGFHTPLPQLKGGIMEFKCSVCKQQRNGKQCQIFIDRVHASCNNEHYEPRVSLDNEQVAKEFYENDIKVYIESDIVQSWKEKGYIKQSELEQAKEKYYHSMATANTEHKRFNLLKNYKDELEKEIEKLRGQDDSK